MKIDSIITNRLGCDQCYWQIVHEWEDCLSRSMGVPLRHNLLSVRLIRGIVRKIFGNVSCIPIKCKLGLSFVCAPFFQDENIAGKENVIPVIIDFWRRGEREIQEFVEHYRMNPAVLITSKEAYEYLLPRVGGLRIFHWPLSVPDFYRLEPAQKKIDCALVGRTSGLLLEWLLRYQAAHQSFTCIYNVRDPKTRAQSYRSSTGELIGDAFKSREWYFNLLRSVKVGLYSTPSMDNDKLRFNGFDSKGYNQVTPRFLEYLAAGCHVIARYPRNADTDYYEMDKISYGVNTYEEFEARMDWALTHDVDREKYSAYLARHCTSSRIKSLNEILKSLQ